MLAVNSVLHFDVHAAQPWRIYSHNPGKTHKVYIVSTDKCYTNSKLVFFADVIHKCNVIIGTGYK